MNIISTENPSKMVKSGFTMSDSGGEQYCVKLETLIFIPERKIFKYK